MGNLNSWIYKVMNLSYGLFLGLFVCMQLQYYVPILFSDAIFDRTLAQNRNLFIDFRMDYALGKMLTTDQSKSLYDPQAQFIQFTKTIQPVPQGGIGYICYTPFFYLLIFPLSSLPVRLALLLWVCSSLALSIAGLTLLGKQRGLSIKQILLVLLGTISCEPAVYCLILGQTSHYFVGILSFFFLGIMSRLESIAVVATIAMVLALIKVQYGVLTIIVALARRRWKLLATAGAITIILLVLTAPYLGWANISMYPATVNTTSQRQDLDFAFFSRTLISLRAPLVCLLPWNLANILTRVQAFLGLTFIGWIWWQARRGNQETLRWAMALTVVVGLLTSAHSHIYDCLLLSIPAILTMPTIDLAKIVKLRPFCLYAWCSIMYFFPAASLTYVNYYQMFSPCDFIGFIFVELLLAISGFFCFQQSLKAEKESAETVILS